jgi:hypothetical protein
MAEYYGMFAVLNWRLERKKPNGMRNEKPPSKNQEAQGLLNQTPSAPKQNQETKK